MSHCQAAKKLKQTIRCCRSVNVPSIYAFPSNLYCVRHSIIIHFRWIFFLWRYRRNEYENVTTMKAQKLQQKTVGVNDIVVEMNMKLLSFVVSSIKGVISVDSFDDID